MPETSGQSSNTLPRPELNPLLNPLLAENMNRWAEVYFNNPPERRDEAVLELVHELEAQRALREAAAATPRTTFHNAPTALRTPPAVQSANSSAPQQEVELVRCERCGRDNPSGHKFCGMCGETLHPKRAENLTANPTYADEVDTGQNEENYEYDRGSEGNYVPPASNFNGLSLFQAGPEQEYYDYDEADAAYESSHSGSYRVYIGALLAIILLALGYTAWRASQNSQASDESSPVPPITAKDPLPAAAPATNPAPAPNPSSAPKDAAANAAASAAAKPTPPANDAPSRTDAHASRKAVGVQQAALDTPEHVSRPKSGGGGGEELAQAQSYLNAQNGRGRNSAAAAQMLWKSVAKHNGEATLLLADLYLKGDGVSKNCDQARVLLDSAARKGISGAATRLRNLQAFGCQ